jgi:hypothetical protein
MTDYPTFLARKAHVPPASGFDVALTDLHPSLFPWQAAIVQWALKRGRAALFEDTGLGKSRQILEWMRCVSQYTGKQVLLVTPLAVAHQFTRSEAPAIDVWMAYCRSQTETNQADCSLIVTNYDMVQHFNPAKFAGIALDEADVLANFTGKRKRLLMSMFRDTPYKLVATATPAPNSLPELGNYAEHLGVMSSGEMLTRYFLRDSNDANNLRLRHWANSGPFWDWLVQWSVCIGLPSDYGDYSDDGYILPPLTIEQHTVDVSYGRAWEQGKLFPDARQSATDLWATKRETHIERCALAAELVGEKRDVPWIVWCSTDEESKLLTRLIPDAVEVKGSHKPAEKEKRLRAFSEGRARIIISKAEICGQGLNWQHCADMAFVSPTFSFKDFYHGLRRIYRFRQEKPVTCHVIIAETEESVLAAVQRKQEQHQQMHAKARVAMKRQATLTADASEEHEQAVQLPEWLSAPVEEGLWVA